MKRHEIAAACRAAGSDAPEQEASLLLSELFGVSPTAALLDRERDYSSAALDAALARRAQHEPIQYILGRAYFCGETYLLNRDCLIPRPDSELLVTESAHRLPPHGRFADLFCGSGCVGISLAAMRKDASGIGIDLSPGAVTMAVQNAALNRVSDRIRFLCADISDAPLGTERFDLITANPPYITDDEMTALSPEVLREPELALRGGKDGLDLFRMMLSRCGGNLTDNGTILCEIGWKQGKSAASAAEHAGFSCTILPDLEGRDRISVLRKEASLPHRQHIL